MPAADLHKIAWVLAAVLVTGGCQSDKAARAPRDQKLAVRDFVATPAEPADEAKGEGSMSMLVVEGPPATALSEPAAESAAAAEAGVESSPSQPAAEAPTSAEESAEPGPVVSQPVRPYTVDAMVGQVNGRPLYASRVLEPIHEQLQSLGSRLPRAVFRDRAEELIARSLTQIIADALILGEAQRDLTQGEEAALQNILKTEREKLLRQWGMGSQALADEQLRTETGKSLADTLVESRQRLLISRYMHRKLLPKINVTKKDIERYYNDHYSEFNPAATRTVRLIRVKDGAAAKRIEERLEAGQSFAEVAGDSANTHRSKDGGLWPSEIVGDKAFGQPELNEALQQLGQGQASSRIEADGASWWLFVEKMTQPQTQPLREVQLKIEDILRTQQFQMLTQQYRRDLFERGSYNSIPEMTQALVGIAVSRYALLE